jgi:hypothetical protein
MAEPYARPKQKSRERVPLRADVDFDTLNFGSEIENSENVKSACGTRLM